MRHIEQIQRDLRQAEKDKQNAEERIRRFRAELKAVGQAARQATSTVLSAREAAYAGPDAEASSALPD